jgi:hypothetical protein
VAHTNDVTGTDTDEGVEVKRMIETAFVSAEIGGEFVDASELHKMKSREAMSRKDTVLRQEAVEEERQRMKPKGSEVLTSTGTRLIEEMGATVCSYEIGLTAAAAEMAQQGSKVQRARMNARGYEQVNGMHYDDNYEVAPMANEIVLRMAIVLLVMAKWMVHGLIKWSTCVWECLIFEKKGEVLTAKEGFRKRMRLRE